jgi:tight adherence protein C
MSSSASQYSSLVMGIAGLLLMTAAMSFFAMALPIWHAGLKRRVDQLVGTKPPPAVAVAAPADARGSRSPAAGSGLMSRQQAELVRRLGPFGVPAERCSAVLLGLRLALGGLVALLLALALWRYGHALPLPLQWLLSVLAGCASGWLLPVLVLRAFLSRHVKAAERGLPDAIDLLVVSIEAGLALEEGLDRIVPELRRGRPALAEELGITAADLKILPSQEMAFAKLAERVDVPSVRSIATTLSQTMHYGTPLGQALRTVAAELRNDGLVRAEERANRLPALMTIPMMVFILPATFLIVIGPAALRLFETIGR